MYLTNNYDLRSVETKICILETNLANSSQHTHDSRLSNKHPLTDQLLMGAMCRGIIELATAGVSPNRPLQVGHEAMHNLGDKALWWQDYALLRSACSACITNLQCFRDTSMLSLMLSIIYRSGRSHSFHPHLSCVFWMKLQQPPYTLRMFVSR